LGTPPPLFLCLLYNFSQLKVFSREFLAQTAKTCRRFYIYGVPATAGVPGVAETESKEKHGAGVDYIDNLTLCPLQSRLQHIYRRQPYAGVDIIPMPESRLFPLVS
jgi:hypothetical protein